MKAITRWIATMLGVLSALLGCLHFFRLRARWGYLLLPFKLAAGAFAPLLALLGWAGAVLGLLSGAPAAVVGGLFGMLAGLRHTRRVQASDPFALVDAFGGSWPERIAPETSARMLPTRHGPMPQSPNYAPKPFLERDVVYYTLPNHRRLLCDVWSPPAGREHSGLAIIYAHGGAWTAFDKDFGTRPLFRHLAGQGHVIIDLAYRMYPEVQLPEMLHDVQRGVAFARLNAAHLGIDPQRLVLGGASGGGHLSLLAAYTAPAAPELAVQALIAPELTGHDLSVRGVFSFYGPCDLAECYTHTCQEQLPAAIRQRAAAPAAPVRGQIVLEGPAQMNTLPAPRRHLLAERAGGAHSPIHTMGWLREELEKTGGVIDLAGMLGCQPGEAPERYALFSPLAHAHSACPPTLLVQGADDLISPPAAALALAGRLKDLRVPVVCRILPEIEHGFDLVAPKSSPSALTALYDLERFLALIA